MWKGVGDKENECKCTKGIGDGEKKETYDSEFVEVVGGGYELKDFIGVCILLFLYLFGFWYFVLCFYFKGDKKLSEDVGFNSNIKDSSVKDGVDGDEVLKDSNLIFFIIVIYVGFIFYFWLPIHFLYPFGLFLVSDSFFCILLVNFWFSIHFFWF